MKKCSKCQEEKPLELFAKDGRKSDGRRGICKKCHSAYQSEYFKNNPKKRQPNPLYDTNYLRHGISKNQWEFLLGVHDGKCWICKTRPATSIDHDHRCCPKTRSCGKCVRGILCGSCNTAIGSLGDTVDGVMNAVLYLKQYNLGGLPLAM